MIQQRFPEIKKKPYLPADTTAAGPDEITGIAAEFTGTAAGPTGKLEAATRNPFTSSAI